MTTHMLFDVILPALQLSKPTAGPAASAAPPPSFSPGVRFYRSAISAATHEEESEMKAKKGKGGSEAMDEAD